MTRSAFDARSSNTARLLGLGQCLHAWPEPGAAKKAFPGRASVAVTGEAGLGYMLGNLEVLLREKLRITVTHSSNGGFAGYGPGFWGPGHDPCTPGAGPDELDMSKVIGALGFHTEGRASQSRSSRPCGGRSTSISQVARPISSSS